MVIKTFIIDEHRAAREMLARYVMPQFQRSVASIAGANRWVYERRETLMAGQTRAIDRAKQEYVERERQHLPSIAGPLVQR